MNSSLYDLVRTGKSGYRVVFTNGVFDILHPGHLRVLRRCRDIAGFNGVVVVGVNTDESTRRLKGPSRPVNKLDDRMDVLSALVCVDYVISFDEDTPYRLIKEIKPNYIVKGGDYLPETVVGGDLAEVVIVETDPMHSTTGILQRIAAS